MTLKQASAKTAQAEAAYAAAEQQLIERVCTAYFGVLSAAEHLDSQQATLVAISGQLEEASRRFAAGVVGITDVEEAHAARDQAASAVIAAKRALAEAGDDLQEITGKPYESLAKPGYLPLPPPTPASQDRWVAMALEQNLALIASRLRSDIARDAVQVAFAGHLPTVDLVAGRSYLNSSASGIEYGAPANNLPSNVSDKSISLEVTVPIFSGGYTTSKVRQAQYEWIAAKDAVIKTSRATERGARKAYWGAVSGIARVQTLRDGVASAEKALEASETGYEVGTRTSADVLNARQRLLQVKIDYTQTRYDTVLAEIELKYAAGTLNRTDLEAINRELTAVTALVPGTSSPTPQSLTPAAPAEAPADAPISPITVRPSKNSGNPEGQQPTPR